MIIQAAAGHNRELIDIHLTKCALHISDSYFDRGLLIIASIFPTDTATQTRRIWNFNKQYHYCDNAMANGDLFHSLHFSEKWQILRWFPFAEEQKFDKTLQDFHYKSSGYILRVPNQLGFLSRQLKILRSYRNSWNSRARFVILVDETLPDPSHVAEGILKEVEHFKIFNVVVVIPSDGLFRALDIYTWFPYELPSGQCGKFKKPVVLDHWIMEGKGRPLRNVSLFPPKIPHNFGGCKITASIIPGKPFVMSLNKKANNKNISVYDEGSDIRLFLFIAVVMNLSRTFTPSVNMKEIWPVKLANGSWTGALGEVFDKKSDIAFSGLSINLERYIYFDVTKVYYFSGLLWVVPCAESLERVTSISRVFSASLWLLTLIMIILSAGFMYSVSTSLPKFIEEADQYRTISNCFYNVWATFLGISVPKMPVTDHLKIFFVMLVWYSLAINIVFQAFATSYLIEPGFQKQITSLEDLIESGIDYGYYPGIDVLLSSTPDWKLKEVLSKRVPCYNESCVARAIETKDFASLSDTMYTEYMKAYAGTDSYGRSAVCSFKQECKVRLVAMYLKKGSFLTEGINRVINVAIEAGLNNFWWKSILDTVRSKAVGVKGHILIDDYTVLLLDHLQGAFYLLLLGHGLALVTFIGELLHNRLKAKSIVLKTTNNKTVLAPLTCRERGRRNNWNKT
jgi:ABC-type amino acid transport substrate-binding protein